MDFLSIIAFVLALIAVIGGAILKGSSAGALVGSAAFVIVVLGTFAASLMQTRLPTFLRAWRIVSWVFKPPSDNPSAMIEKIVGALGDSAAPRTNRAMASWTKFWARPQNTDAVLHSPSAQARMVFRLYRSMKGEVGTPQIA